MYTIDSGNHSVVMTSILAIHYVSIVRPNWGERGDSKEIQEKTPFAGVFLILARHCVVFMRIYSLKCSVVLSIHL